MIPSQFYTVTMAELYAKQGYLRKAAQIYASLVRKEPHRDDLRAALQKIEQEIGKQIGPSRKELGFMLREWMELLKKQRDLKRKKHST